LLPGGASSHQRGNTGERVVVPRGVPFFFAHSRNRYPCVPRRPFEVCISRELKPYSRFGWFPKLSPEGAGRGSHAGPRIPHDRGVGGPFYGDEANGIRLSRMPDRIAGQSEFAASRARIRTLNRHPRSRGPKNKIDHTPETLTQGHLSPLDQCLCCGWIPSHLARRFYLALALPQEGCYSDAEDRRNCRADSRIALAHRVQ